MKRYYIYKFALHDAILIDTEKKGWTFYNTNIYGQVYNLDEKMEKVKGQRINGLIRRLNSRKYSSLNGYVVDQFVYNYIMTDEQKEKCDRSVTLKEKKLIASGDNLKEVMKTMCVYLLEQSDLSDNRADKNYYINKLDEIV